MKSKYKLKFFYPNYFSDRLIAYVCLTLAKNMSNDSFETSVMGITSDGDITLPYYKNAIPVCMRRIIYRIFSPEIIEKFAEYRFARSVKKGDIVYLWPQSSVSLFRKIKNMGCIIIKENINTHTAYAKKILDTEYSKFGFGEYKEITDKSVSEENFINSHVDYIFSPSPIVTESLLKSGIKSDSILLASYGLRKSDILENIKRDYNKKYVTFIFVGTICIRKGVHLLLDAWQKAGVIGRLILVGKIDNDIKDFVTKHLSDNVIHISFTDNLSDIYSEADVFILPSLEEGSPLVTYLALGAGLPSIVSPMGAGGIIDETTGIIISPRDGNALVEAIRRMSTDGKLRKTLSKNAHKKANDYTWDKVGKKRAKLLKEKIESLENNV